jgi:Holliday junction resolvase
MFTKRKGYRVERKIRLKFEQAGWKVIRAGASLGEADLICIKEGKCILLQIKSSKKQTLYYYGYMEKKFEGFPFYLVVDFGYGKIKILNPKNKVGVPDGLYLDDFLKEKK